MQSVLCLELLLLTVFLWVAIFGVVDLLMQKLFSDEHSLAFYTGLGVAVSLCVWAWHGVSACSLM